MVPQTLAAIGALHRYGFARRIEQRGWIAAKWGMSDNNRKAKFYSITRKGRKQLAADVAYWERLSRVMGRMLTISEAGEKA